MMRKKEDGIMELWNDGMMEEPFNWIPRRG
jgi:hypothetical protein